MERDQQRLLDVIGDPNALENFLGLSSFPAEHQMNRAYTQSPAIASPASVIQAASPFSAPFASASPNPANLRSPAPSPAPQPQPLQPVHSPAPNVQAGLRHAPSPLQQPMRPGSVPNTPVPSPVSYPPGPGPGVPISMANFSPSVLQALHNSGAITFNSGMLQGMPQIMGGTVQQLMGGSMVQIVSAPSLATSHPPQHFQQQQQQQQPQPAQPQTVNLSSTPPLRPTPLTPGGRAKQPQLLPKPSQSNSNSNSPKTTNLARTVALKVPSPAPQPAPNPTPQLQHHLQHTQVQAQPTQQFFQTHHSSPQPNGGSIMFNQGAVLASQSGGTMVLNSVIPTLGHAPGATNGVAAAGGQQFLIQQPGGGFQLLVRPPTQTPTQSPSLSPQQQQRGHTILVPHPLGGLTNAQIIRPHTQSHLTAQTQQPQQQQPMLRFISPGLGAVQLQQIQTPNGPAYIAVQQHANPQAVNLQALTNLPNVRTVTATQNATPSVPTAQLFHPNVNMVPVSEDRTTPQHVFNQESVQNVPEPPPPQPPPPPVVPPTPEAPPPKKPPPKKRPKKKKKEEEKKEVKKLNLEELLKESGITGDDEDGGFDFGFGSVEEATPNPQPPPPQPQPQVETPAIPAPEVLPVSSSVPLQLTIGEDGQLVFQGGQGLNSQEVNQALRQALQQQGWSLAAPQEAPERSAETPQVDQSKPVIQQTVQVGQNPAAQAQKDQQPSIGFQNSFLESLARSQNIPTPKKPKKSYPKKPKKKKEEPKAPPPAPAVTAAPVDAAPAAPMVVVASEAPNGQMNNGVGLGNNTQKSVQTAVNGMPTYIIAPGGGAVAQVTPNNPTPPSNATTVVSVVNISSGQMMPTNMTTPTVVTAGGGNVVHRVQTIQLTPQNQQSLRNIQAQIQYLTSKKDPSPQESTLLQKLIQHQQKILMTGKPIPTIPGQHAQGVQFNAPANASSQIESDQIPQHGTTIKGVHNKPVPANIQQNTHLANLLRGDKPAMASRMTTANVNQAAQPVRYFHQIGNQVISLTPQQSRPATMVATAVPQQSIPATPTGPQPVRQVVIMPHALAQPVSSIVTSSSASTSVSSSVVTTTTPVMMGAGPVGAAAKVTMSSNTAAKVIVVPATSSSSTTTVASTSGTTNQGSATCISSVAPETSSVTTSNIVTVVKTEPTTVATPTFPRGVKRGAITPPKPTISKSTLFEHQLKTDQNGALTPDCKSPFKNKSNACKRLIRYHVFHEKEPHPKEEEKAEEWFEATADHFALKFRQMLNKYHYLLLMDSMKEAPASEYVMIDRLFVAEEKGTLERLKEEAAQPKKEEEIAPVPVMEEVVVKKEVEARFPKLKLSRKEGEHYKSELKEVRVVMEDVVRNGYYKKEGYEYDTASQDSSNSMTSQSFRQQQQQPTSQQYDEWEAIRNEVAFFTQEEGGGAPGSSATAPFPLQDDLLHSQVQSAIDGILNLQKVEGDGDLSGLSAMDLESNTGAVGIHGHEAMDYETSLNHYEGSMMDECSDGTTDGQGDVALSEAVRSILT